MDLIRLSISKPVAVTVGVILVLLMGVLALTAIPIQLTPSVDPTVITVTTFWEGASPSEIEQDVIQEQEEKLKTLASLKKMTSQSNYATGTITLEFFVGTDKDSALREVSEKLREVPSYPENVDEPVITDGDPQNRDYIAWIILQCADPDFDVRTLQDFAEDRIKPALERVAGVSEINVLGGWEREVQVRVDPVRLAQRGVTYSQLADALRTENVNVSGGTFDEGKLDVSVRTVGRYDDPSEIDETIIAYTQGGPIRVGDVAESVLTYKEAASFVRSRGQSVIAINAQREIGSNVMQVMEGLKEAIARVNAPGGLLDVQSRQLGLSEPLVLRQVYDQTIYIDQAINLVVSNIYVGGVLAVITLILFLRSVRSVGIIALAIPISVIGTFVAMVAMGRNLNVISLAGLAFAVGMVVDNAIVVLENIFRHLEEGKPPFEATYRGAKEVWGAVLASTLTTVAVFIPILFIEEEAGQLFRDIALAICASVLLSLVVSITVIPCAARGWLRLSKKRNGATPKRKRFDLSTWYAALIYRLCGSVVARAALVLVIGGGAIIGSILLMPPSDYLPAGNRNLVFGMMIPPPGYTLDKMEQLADRVEVEIRPFWEAGKVLQENPEQYEQAVAALPTIPTFNMMTGQAGPNITPPSIENYFFVGLNSGIMFHGGVSDDDTRVVDMEKLFNYATRQENLPGVYGFAFQVPLFRLGGSSGSSIEVEFYGDDLSAVVTAADAMYQQLGSKYGYGATQAQPGNFSIPGPELQISIDRIRASELGITTRDLGLAVAALADGQFVGEYYGLGESIDIKIIDKDAVDERGRFVARDAYNLADIPVATPAGNVVPLTSVATLTRTTAPQSIARVEEQRAVTLEFTPPSDMPLETAMADVSAMLEEMRSQGVIDPMVETNLAGSADKLTAVRSALLGDGTWTGLIGSRMFLALLVVYLLMCVLFESFLYPLVILLSVPLAAFGGFLGLAAVHYWSVTDPYMPDQKLDVLTMLGFVILIGIVVNNAILLVHQSLNLMRGLSESGEALPGDEPMPSRKAIAESVRTRIRPIFMSTLTSVGGMLPLVLMPGSGSELYRGLGSVVTGGLLLSTFFTLLIVPLLFSLVVDFQEFLAHRTPLPVSAPAGSAPQEPAAPTPTPKPAPRPAEPMGRPEIRPRPASTPAPSSLREP